MRLVISIVFTPLLASLVTDGFKPTPEALLAIHRHGSDTTLLDKFSLQHSRLFRCRPIVDQHNQEFTTAVRLDLCSPQRLNIIAVLETKSTAFYYLNSRCPDLSFF